MPRELRYLLVVEDDDDDAILVRDLLEGWPDLRIEVAPTIAAAEERLGQAPPDCVLLDLGLPDASGLEALERLQALRTEIAFVVLTGYIDEQRGIDALSAGAQDYLVKGRIDADSLMRAIRYAVERKTAERSRQELAVARAHEAENSRLQRGLLPAPIVDNKRFVVQTAYQPGSRRQLLGGDFFDVVQDPKGRLHVVIGDVCGHGPDEAALGVRMRMAWRTLILAGAPHDELLDTLERVLTHERDRDAVFTSLIDLDVDEDCHTASIRLAGHPPPILVSNGRSRLLDECAYGPVLGLVEGGQWPVTEVSLDDAWTLVLFTDGLYEGRIDDGPERLGTEGLLDLLRAHPLAAASTGSDSLQALISEVERLNGGPLTDDVAILAVSCDGPA